MGYYAVHRSKSDDELTHWKYISKKKVNGKWRYVYDKDSAKKKSKNKLSNAFNKTLAKGEKWVYNKFLKDKTAKKSSKSKISKWVSKGKKKVDTFFDKTNKKVLKTYKYIKKIPMAKGKYRYFYDIDDYNAYLRRLEYQKNEPDFMEKVKEINKHKLMDPEDDMKVTNPKYDPYNPDYSMNCFRCSVAYELRRRGYDVTANEAGNDQTSYDFKNIYKNPKTFHIESNGRVVDKSDMYNRDKEMTIQAVTYSAKTIKQAIEKNNPPNSRGALNVYWKQGGGHSIVYEIDSKGHAVLRDAQSNRTFSFNDLAENVIHVQYTRTDNLELKKGALDYIEK